MTKIITANGTVLNEFEIDYRKKLISDSKSLWCPIMKTELISVMKGEILYISGVDYFISDNGIAKLKGIYGDKFINERIITYD